MAAKRSDAATASSAAQSRSTAAERAEALKTAHLLADAAGVAILPYFRRRLLVENKAGSGGFDPVTKADRAAEKAIAKLIRERHPEHGIVGEEFGVHQPGARYQWVIDPIDGTRAFILGLPLWGTLIALCEDNAAILGVADQPYTGERYVADHRVSRLRDRHGREVRLKTRACSALADAMVMTTHPDLFVAPQEKAAFEDIKGQVRMTRYGGDCYAYCQLAAGHVDLIIESGLKAHDVAALIPIIERAGGRMTTWTGGPAMEAGRIVASGDPRLHEIVLRRLAAHLC